LICSCSSKTDIILKYENGSLETISINHNIRTLTIKDKNITGISGLEKLPDLNTLNLRNNKISNIDWIRKNNS